MKNFPKANINRHHTGGRLTHQMLQSYRIVELNTLNEELSVILQKIDEKTLQIAKLNMNFLDEEILHLCEDEDRRN
tara:strand:+ start:160 stop:387 length:228 start_codon:yes stop_codon:yes gene_type:complete